MYWIYRTHIYRWRGKEVEARLLQPTLPELLAQHRSQGFYSPLQDEPYGAELALTCQVNPQAPQPDNYFQSSGFAIYSARLIALLEQFQVRFEAFPVTLVDKQGAPQPDLRYFLFHSLEGTQDALDAAASGWTGDYDAGIARLALDPVSFEPRPIFKCDHIYLDLMRDDLKQAVVAGGITGFAFLHPDKFRSGRFGFEPEYED